MSQHFVTVCVVCVLCAAHTPCSAHSDFSSGVKLNSNLRDSDNLYNEQFQITDHPLKIQNELQLMEIERMNLKNYHANMKHKEDKEIKTKNHEYKDLISNQQNQEEREYPIDLINFQDRNSIAIMERLGQNDLVHKDKLIYEHSTNKHHKFHDNNRQKRHIDENEKYFMRKIFESYGDGTSITLDGFEKLLTKLGLLKMVTEISKLDSKLVNTNHNTNQLGNTKNVQSSELLNSNKDKSEERCLSSKELLSSVANGESYTSSNQTIPDWLFEHMCPLLLYQLADASESGQQGCIRLPRDFKVSKTDNNHVSEEDTRNMVQVWVYSTISIVVISLCGLFGVAVIPVMGKTYYHQLIQFLVALAVGTLCGDALIHLLPHAMMSEHSHDHEIESSDHEEEHNSKMWKGLVAMIGLVLFFFTEKALTLLAEWRKRRHRRDKLPSRVRVMREPEGPNSNVVGEKLCKHKYSTYPYCYGEITTDAHENHNHRHNNLERPVVIEEEKPLTDNCKVVSKIVVNDSDKKDNEEWSMDDAAQNAKKNGDEADLTNESESYTVIIREHETKHHGHTHSHGHVHSAPESMSSVAWMVIMGDGLHNFTDGMAIGAAFAANIAGGFSTAIAVLCHELPHELGDFAVLLKAGMSAKQAVFYNLLSSVLCLFGMIVGVSLGSTPGANSWMFAAAAGMFIYIALVDMMPELSSNHSADSSSSKWHCVLQGLGLTVGLGIMLVIAMYEHDLKHIFNA